MDIDHAGGAGRGPGVVAVYARLSVNENGERDESLETQCRLLAAFAGENRLGDCKFYVDSDVSGTYFDRPGLLQMVEDINQGLVATVLVKDLSRLGRNNGETLTFLDFLREKNVRLISLGDNYDSFRDDDDTIGIRTWVNEYYARDISRKVRVHLKNKMRRGEYLGRPPFGYKKSAGRKNKLEVDERYRHVIQEIFQLYIEGWGYRALAEYLQCRGVPTPSQVKGYARAPQSDRWDEQQVRRIITNRVYCGDAVQGVTEKISFKSRKTRRVPADQWIIVPGAHEAIVSRETFELAQRVRRKRWLAGEGRKKSKAAPLHLFSGFLLCAGCGSGHVFRKKKNRAAAYVCGRYNRFGRAGCSSHRVAEEDLVRYILRDVRRLAAGTAYRSRLAELYAQTASFSDETERQISRLQEEIDARRRQLRMAYLDRLQGVISQELFLETRAKLEREAGWLSAQRDKLALELAGCRERKEVMRVINGLHPGMLAAEDIDREFLEKFVHKIVVLEKGEQISAAAAEKSGLNREGLAAEALGSTGLIVVYNLRPVST